MLINHGGIIRHSRIPPEFVAIKQVTNLVAADQTFEYIIPEKKNFTLNTFLLFRNLIGAETVLSTTFGIRKIGESLLNEVLLLRGGAAATGITTSGLSITTAPQSGIYIPQNYILRVNLIASAGVQIKIYEFHLVGWLVPAYDVLQ